MKRAIIAVTLAVLVAGIGAGPAEAKNKDKKKKQQTTVTMTAQQFQMLLEMIASKPQTITIPAQMPEKGATGAAGAKGPKGDRGATGAAGTPGKSGQNGANGIDGQDGVDGKDGIDGVDGKDGVGFTPGAIFLTNGACPERTTMQGAQNRWTVYANDTNGRPWLSSGSSAQLFLSACQVN